MTTSAVTTSVAPYTTYVPEVTPEAQAVPTAGQPLAPSAAPSSPEPATGAAAVVKGPGVLGLVVAAVVAML